MEGIPILDLEADCISTMLKKNTTIKRLRLRNTGISDRCLAKIAAGISMHPMLGDLDLSYNVFEKEGLMRLMEALEKT